MSMLSNMMRDLDSEVVLVREDDPQPEPTQPPPALKRKATKRGLSKTILNNDDNNQVEMPSHVTNVYSNCIKKSVFSFSGLGRKPLFAKQGNDLKQQSDVSEPWCAQRKVENTLSQPETPAVVHVINEDSDSEDENGVICLDDSPDMRSPSPPVPPPPPVQQKKPKRMNRQLQKALKKLDSMKGELTNSGNMSSPSPSVIILDSPEENDHLLVRVRHIGDVHRFSMAKTDIYYSLQVQMANLLGVEVDQIGLYLNDSRLHHSDTPRSTNLHLADIIVCHVLVSQDDESSESNSDYCIKVQMQCSTSRRKTQMVIKRFHQLKVMMENYAQIKGKPLEKFQFLFDGERLDPEKTAMDVDLDDDDTIDVVERT